MTATATAQPAKATARLLVDAGEITLADALTVVPTQPVLSSLSPNKLYLGQGTVDVAISGSNFTDKSTLQINNNPVTVQHKSNEQLKASIETPSNPTDLSFKVLTPDPFNEGQNLISNELILTVVKGQLTIDPKTLTLTKGLNKTISVTLPYPAAGDGMTVDLASSASTVGNVPATVVIPAGQTSASFDFAATNTGNTTITASKIGFLSAQVQVTVTPPPALTLLPSQLSLGLIRTVEVSVQSNVVAGAGGITVALASSNTGVVTVPPSVTIPAETAQPIFLLSLGLKAKHQLLRQQTNLNQALPQWWCVQRH